jgi:5-methylthioadenosine/S-adenosylhomocysteine deaminase
MTTELVIQGCGVLNVPASGPCVVEPLRDLHISGGVVTGIHPSGTGMAPAAEVVKAHGLIAVPGLSNAHAHSPMVLMRGAAEDVSVDDWFNTRVWPMEVNLTPDRVRVGARLACAEMLLGGVTAFADHYFCPEQIADAAQELGIRANIAPTFFTDQGVEARDAAIRQAVELRDRGSDLVTASLGPHSTYTVSEADLAHVAEMGRREGIPVHVHAAENVEQTRSSLARLGVTPIQVLDRTGVLGAGALIAHGGGITSDDLALLAQHRDRVGVACCPKGYFKHALDPITPIQGLLNAGIRVGVGTDGAAVANTMDVWEQARLTALAQKRQTGDALFLDVSETIRLATRGGASIAPFGGAGHIAIGQPADIALVDLSGPHCQPVHDPIATLLYSMRASDVRTVLVAGRVVVRDRRLETADLDEIIREAAAVAPELVRVRPGASVQRYEP